MVLQSSGFFFLGWRHREFPSSVVERGPLTCPGSLNKDSMGLTKTTLSFTPRLLQDSYWNKDMLYAVNNWCVIKCAMGQGTSLMMLCKWTSSLMRFKAIQSKRKKTMSHLLIFSAKWSYFTDVMTLGIKVLIMCYHKQSVFHYFHSSELWKYFHHYLWSLLLWK